MSEDLNGGRPSVIVYETLSGVLIHITPLSIFTIQSIRERAEQELPYPDPAPYEKPLKNAVDASIKEPASNDPAYKELCQAVDKDRLAWRIAAYIDVACEFPAFDSREAMIAHFRPQLEKLRKVTLMGSDDWQNVLDACVFTGKPDKQTVVWIATQDGTIPLTPAEVVEGIRFFRLDVQGRTP